MPARFPCRYLESEVELTDERLAHISQEHPEIIRAGLGVVESTLDDPDLIRQVSNTHVFSRWYDEVEHGKHVVVVVVTDMPLGIRHWIVTSHVTNRVPERDIIWRRN